MPDNVVNPALIKVPAYTLDVVDDSGKKVGAIAQSSLQKLLHTLGDKTNAYLYDVGVTTDSTLLNTSGNPWITVAYSNTLISGLSAPITFEITLNTIMQTSFATCTYHFEVSTSAQGSVSTISLLHAMQGSFNLGNNKCPFLNARTVTQPSSGNSFEFQVQLNANIAFIGMSVSLWWNPLTDQMKLMVNKAYNPMAPTIHLVAAGGTAGAIVTTLQLNDTGAPFTPYTAASIQTNGTQNTWK